jgi:DDE family transposase
VRILDGNHLSATEHRIEELRTTWAAPLPGKVLAVLEPETGLASDVLLTPDGHAQERSLLDEVLEIVRERDVWIADRNFCTLKFLFEIAKKLGCFIIRQHGTLKGKLCGRRVFMGEGPTGKIYEQAIEFVYEGTTYKLRRITIELIQATRDGDTRLHLLTNLPTKVSALKAAELYRKRWTIETLFLEVTTTLTCEIHTLCYPKAALFVFCLALVAANAVAVVKAALRAVHGDEKADELSGYYLALEVKQVHQGMMIAVPPACWEAFVRMKPGRFAKMLKQIAAHVDLEIYRKSPRGPKKPPPKKSRYQNGGHVSTHKLLTDHEH